MELSLIIGAVLGATLNRFSGYENISWLPGRNVYYSALALFALSWVWVGPLWAALIFISFGAYRIPGWYKSLDMGTHGGTVIGDALMMWFRGLWFIPFFAYAFLLGNKWALVTLLLASGAATLCYLIGNHILPKFTKVDPFWFIEAGAGASFGVAVVKTALELNL